LEQEFLFLSVTAFELLLPIC